MCLNRIVNITKGTVLIGLMMTVNNIMAQQPVNKTVQAPVQKLTLTGKITDAATRKPIAGARITVSDFSAAITDSTGAFKINVVTYNDNIVIAAEGYEPRQIALKQRQTLDVSLQDASLHSFQENITIPFAAAPKR